MQSARRLLARNVMENTGKRVHVHVCVRGVRTGEGEVIFRGEEEIRMEREEESSEKKEVR